MVTRPRPGHRGAPSPRPPRRGGRVLRVLAVIAAAAVVVTGGGWLLVRHYTNNITRKNVFANLSGRPDRLAGKAETVLLVGSDSRAGAVNGQFQGSGADFVGGARSDTAILAHLSADRNRALLVSIPRDSYVAIPACPDATGVVHLPVHGKFNAAFAEGGGGCSVATVEALTGVRVDHYAEVDFAGFQSMVSALGGVDVCLPSASVDVMSGLNLPAGVSHVDGEQALAFVRARYALGDGSDLGRIQRQQQFIAAVLRKATSTGLLLRPDRLLAFLDAATKSVTTDSGLSVVDLRELATGLKGLDPAKVTFVTVPLADADHPVDGVGSTVLWDDAQAGALWAAMRTDGVVPAAGAPGPAPAAGAPPGTSTAAQDPCARR